MDGYHDSASSDRSTRQPPFDGYFDVEEMRCYDDYNDDCDDYDYDYDDYYRGDHDGKSELACPFCTEDFDLVGFCCHVDERHILEAKSGVCPICAEKVGMHIVAHLITQHESLLKALCKKKLRNGVSRSTQSLLRKKLYEKHMQSLHDDSSNVVSSSNAVPDSLLFSFVNNQHKPDIRSPSLYTDTNALEKNSHGEMIKSGRNSQSSPADKDQEEKLLKCEFVQDLVLCAIFDDL